MKANFNTLKQALKLCAEAHQAELCDWSEDFQIAIDKDSVPVYSDMKMISEAFFGQNRAHVETCFGYTNLYIDTEFLSEVNVELLSMALPYCYIDKIIDSDN